MARTYQTDIMIHVDEHLDAEMRSRLGDDLRSQAGVINVTHNDKTPHLFIVSYNPDHTRSKDLLGVVLNEQLHAELVGI